MNCNTVCPFVGLPTWSQIARHDLCERVYVRCLSPKSRKRVELSLSPRQLANSCAAIKIKIKIRNTYSYSWKKKETQSNANICCRCCCGAQEAENVEGDFYFYLLKFMCTIFHHRTSISNAELSNEEATTTEQHPHPSTQYVSTNPDAKDDEATNKSLHLALLHLRKPIHWKWNVAFKLLFCNFLFSRGCPVRCFPIWKSISDSFSIVIS